MVRQQSVLPERFDKVAHVVLDYFRAGIEFMADHFHDLRFRCPTLEQFENPRPNAVQVEHLTLLDVQNDGPILSVCAANSFGNSIHQFAPLGTVGCSKCVSHTLTPGAVGMPVILEFVRERVRLVGIGLQPQRYALLATDSAETSGVRLSSRICEDSTVAWRLNRGMFTV